MIGDSPVEAAGVKWRFRAANEYRSVVPVVELIVRATDGNEATMASTLAATAAQTSQFSTEEWTEVAVSDPLELRGRWPNARGDTEVYARISMVETEEGVRTLPTPEVVRLMAAQRPTYTATSDTVVVKVL